MDSENGEAEGNRLGVTRSEFDAGIARLRGRSLRERIRALVAIAPPEHRDRLLREARQTWGENV